jgi:hypothetical protein
MRLGDSQFVDRKYQSGNGKKFSYCLMAAGEAHAEKLIQSDGQAQKGKTAGEGE